MLGITIQFDNAMLGCENAVDLRRSFAADNVLGVSDHAIHAPG
jgi:hypothetical protein